MSHTKHMFTLIATGILLLQGPSVWSQNETPASEGSAQVSSPLDSGWEPPPEDPALESLRGYFRRFGSFEEEVLAESAITLPNEYDDGQNERDETGAYIDPNIPSSFVHISSIPLHDDDRVVRVYLDPSAEVRMDLYDPSEHTLTFIGATEIQSRTGNSAGLFVPCAVTSDNQHLILDAWMGDPGAGGSAVDYGYAMVPIEEADPDNPYIDDRFISILPAGRAHRMYGLLGRISGVDYRLVDEPEGGVYEVYRNIVCVHGPEIREDYWCYQQRYEGNAQQNTQLRGHDAETVFGVIEEIAQLAPGEAVARNVAGIEAVVLLRMDCESGSRCEDNGLDILPVWNLENGAWGPIDSTFVVEGLFAAATFLNLNYEPSVVSFRDTGTLWVYRRGATIVFMRPGLIEVVTPYVLGPQGLFVGLPGRVLASVFPGQVSCICVSGEESVRVDCEVSELAWFSASFIAVGSNTAEYCQPDGSIEMEALFDEAIDILSCHLAE